MPNLTFTVADVSLELAIEQEILGHHRGQFVDLAAQSLARRFLPLPENWRVPDEGAEAIMDVRAEAHDKLVAYLTPIVREQMDDQLPP